MVHTQVFWGGISYGSTTAPVDIGSGGGPGWTAAASGGAGGGLIKIINYGVFVNDGSILADGSAGATSNPYAGGGGAGGSIYILTGTLSGVGTTSANGGSGGNIAGHIGGSGGGGRIVLYYTTNTYTGTTTARGGVTGAYNGGAGTIYTKATAATYGDLLVGNNNMVGANTTAVTNDTFKNFTIQNSARYVATSLLTITGNFTNNATFVAGTGTTTFAGTGNQIISGTLVGSSAFRNLVITNNTGSTTFANAASTTNNFMVVTPGARVEFKSGATTTLVNLIIAGSSGNEIYLHSATPGTRWNLHATGTRAVTYARIKDSSACSSSGNIDVSDGTSLDDGNNLCWNFPSPANLTLSHYRWRADHESEVSAGYYGPEDTALSNRVYRGDRVRLRVSLANSGGSANNYNFKLEYSSSSCSAWTSVSSTGEWKPDLTQYILDGSATTDSGGLSNPAGSFTAGKFMSATSTSPALTLPGSGFTELEYSINSGSSAQSGLTYCFRVTNNGVTTNFTYTVQPQLILRGDARPESGGSQVETNGVGTPRGGGNNTGGGNVEGNGTGTPQSGGSQGGGGGDLGVNAPRPSWGTFRSVLVRLEQVVAHTKEFVV